ncbi:MAG TPA: hypothetical protein VFS20_04710 [Longimicrobium sp.]|nr:hypothetical protein [Longimicrobium sp.]
MKSMRVLVPMAVLVLAACGGGDDENQAGAGDSATVQAGTPISGDTTAAPPPAPAGTVDTAGLGTNPPTAGGALVDTAAVPGLVDTTQGTKTAP